MIYTINIYEVDEGNSNRFALGNILKNPLIIIGLNPSIADDRVPDPTIRKVMGFAEGNGFDSFVMINLYPQRATDGNNLHFELDRSLFDMNLHQIEKLLSKLPNAIILASWGEKILLREYFSKCIRAIVPLTKKHNCSWLKIGQLTKSGHPRHPLYASFELGVNNFDIDTYCNTLK